jgi:hypothetical protein
MSEEKQTIEEIFNSEIERWFSDSGDVYRRLNYPEMNNNSLVMDLGGYIGNFTESIYSRYNCKVMVFEPVNRYYNICNYIHVYLFFFYYILRFIYNCFRFN